MSDLAERLRRNAASGDSDKGTSADMSEAADEIERLRAERDSLRGLLAAVMRNVTAMPAQLARRIDAALAKGGR